MNISTKLVAAIVTALFISTVMVNKGYAACNSSQTKIENSLSDCISGWYKNYSMWSGTKAQARVKAHCTQWGTVVAEVDISNQSDKTLTFTENNRVRVDSNGPTYKIRGIYCCLDAGDNLCYKNQVEKNSAGKIKHVTVSGSSVSSTMVHVGTHKKRYIFCRDNPDDIYCGADPEGDAFTTPHNCGDHTCTVGDCTWHFEQSTAYDSCRISSQYGYSMSISAEDGTSQRCTVNVQCQTGQVVDSHAIHRANSFSAQVWDFDDLHNCSGDLQVGAC